MKDKNINTYKWYNLKSNKIIETYFNNYYNSKNNTNSESAFCKNFYKYELLKRKINTNQILMNFILITIFSRWLDMPLIVKKGGIKFILITVPIFYFSNKYFYLYNLNERLKYQSKVENRKIILESICKEQLEYIIKLNIENSKEEKYRANSLSKYWKEPIAWH